MQCCNRPELDPREIACEIECVQTDTQQDRVQFSAPLPRSPGPFLEFWKRPAVSGQPWSSIAVFEFPTLLFHLLKNAKKKIFEFQWSNWSN